MAEGDGQEVAWLDELVAQVRRWHDEVISVAGGLPGEHSARVYAACARPFQSAFGELIFPTELHQAAALFHAIICDHPFVDGNKRTATMAGLIYLGDRGYILRAPSPLTVRVLGELAVEVAATGMGVDSVIEWFEFLLPTAGKGVQ